MDSERLKSVIRENTIELVRLHWRVKGARLDWDRGNKFRQKAIDAAQEFRKRFDELAFPGGWNGALDRISAGDPEAMEAAICFLEIRPYFNQSGYMFERILRRCKCAPLPEDLKARFETVRANLAAWRASHPRDSSRRFN